MLLALALLVIGGTGLFTGPVQAVIVSFNDTEMRTHSNGSLLCPNRIYTFPCEIDGTLLRFRSFDMNGGIVDSISIDSGTEAPQQEFNFTAPSPMNGITASATVYSSEDLTSVELECRDLDDLDFRSISTGVKDALDAPHHSECCVLGDSGEVLIEVDWEPVDCAEIYVLDIPALGVFNTTETSLSIPAISIIGSLFAIGGAASYINHKCPSNESMCTCNTSAVTCTTCLIATPTLQYTSGSIKTGYKITFIEFPVGGSAYYVNSDGDTANINVVDNVGEIAIDSDVTVFVATSSGSEHCSQELPEPLVSGGGIIVILWILVSILLVVSLTFVGSTIALMISYIKLKGKIANQGKPRDSVMLDAAECEQKL